MKISTVFRFSLFFTIALLPQLGFGQDKEKLPTVNLTVEPGITLFYNSNKTGSFQVYKKTGDIETQLTNSFDSNYWWVRVSPDHKKFLCYRSSSKNFLKSTNNFRNAELWVFNIDGSEGKKLIDLKNNNWRSQGYANWSPDGANIIMAAEAIDRSQGNSYKWHLFVTDSVGKKLIQISENQSMFSEPSFSSDGKQIVYSAQPQDVPITICPTNYLEIYVAEMDWTLMKLKNKRKITRNELWDMSPVFSPNGKNIVYSSVGSCTNLLENASLISMSLDGTKVNELKKDKTSNTAPCFSPEGKSIYLQHRPGIISNYCLARINADGTNFSIIYQGDFDVINPQVIRN